MADKPKFCFGLKKSTIDPEENLLCFSYENVDMPISYSLKDHVKCVYNQGHMNSCSANAVANQLCMSDKNNLINFPLSRLYIYFNSRFIDNHKKITYFRFWDFNEVSL